MCSLDVCLDLLPDLAVTSRMKGITGDTGGCFLLSHFICLCIYLLVLPFLVSCVHAYVYMSVYVYVYMYAYVYVYSLAPFPPSISFSDPLVL